MVMTRLSTLYGILFLATAVALAACNDLGPNQDELELTQEELEMATVILSNSLSDEHGGMVSILYDAVSEVQSDQIRYSSAESSKTGESDIYAANNHPSDQHHRGRGGESGYESSYDPETGEHRISFFRNVDGPVVQRTMAAEYVYIYTDAEGQFLEFPRRSHDLIETIDFKGMREGSTTGLMREHSFARIDTLFLDGLSSASALLTLEGNHSSNGEMKISASRFAGLTNRSYELTYTMEDVQVDKAVVMENGNLEQGITGFMSYELFMSMTVNGEVRDREVSGVIELSGDGTALLRFGHLDRLFRIFLGTGEVEESDNNRPVAGR